MEFHDPAQRLNMNQSGSWRKWARTRKAWRVWCGTYARFTNVPRGLGPSNVRLTHYVTDPGRRRDPSNWMPTTKAAIDGLVDAGVFDDDDSTHVTVLEPRFERGTPNRTRIDITPRSDT